MEMARRHALTDPQWTELAPPLPAELPRTGLPNRDRRATLDGIRRRPRTGAPWRGPPERCGLWQTVHARFRSWRQAGIWDEDRG
jgi:transposase